MLYKAIVRYAKAKRSPITANNSRFSLDFDRVWRGNIQELIDGLEKSMNKTENDFEILKRIMKLQKQSEKELIKIWHTMFDENPEIKSRKYMIAKLAYKIQELAYGGLDVETENKIRNCVKKVTKKRP